jgi:hypothetical protein
MRGTVAWLKAGAGLVCKACDANLRLCPEFLQEFGNDKQALADALADPANTVVEKWMAKVKEYEATREAGGYVKAHMSAEAQESESITCRRRLGYLWSAALFKVHHGKTPREAGHKLVTINNRKGVLLDASFGTPLGVEVRCGCTCGNGSGTPSCVCVCVCVCAVFAGVTQALCVLLARTTAYGIVLECCGGDDPSMVVQLQHSHHMHRVTPNR